MRSSADGVIKNSTITDAGLATLEKLPLLVKLDVVRGIRRALAAVGQMALTNYLSQTAIGIVLFDHPETTLQPLISKFALLQRDLDGAAGVDRHRRELKVHALRGALVLQVLQDVQQAQRVGAARHRHHQARCLPKLTLAGEHGLDIKQFCHNTPR